MEHMKPLTPQEVCSALGLYDFSDYDPSAEPSAVEIATSMLSSAVEFEQDELEKLAAFRGVTVEELLQHEQFGIYRR